MIKLKVIINNLKYITFLSEILPLVFCIYYRNKINTNALKVFFVYSLFLSLFSGVGFFSLYYLNNKSLYYFIVKFYTLFEFVFFAFIFHFLFENANARKYILIAIVPFVAFDILIWTYQSSISTVYPLLTEFLIFIVFIIYFFYEKMSSDLSKPLINKIDFWICVGLFVYFTGNFFYILLVDNSKNANESIKNQLTIIYSSVTIVKNIILGLAFLNKENDEDSSPNIEFPEDTSWGAIHQPIKNS